MNKEDYKQIVAVLATITRMDKQLNKLENAYRLRKDSCVTETDITRLKRLVDILLVNFWELGKCCDHHYPNGLWAGIKQESRGSIPETWSCPICGECCIVKENITPQP
jgi:hypothetical protein